MNFEVIGDLALNSTGTALVVTTRGLRAMQGIQSRLGIIQGTYPYALTEGTRWLSILGEPFAEELIRSELSRVAMKDPEIFRADVTTVSYDTARRKAFAKMRVYFSDETSEEIEVNV